MANENLPNEHDEDLDEDQDAKVVNESDDDSDGDSRQKNKDEDQHEDHQDDDGEITEEEREAIRARRRDERQRKKQAQRDREDTLKRELSSRDQVINDLRDRLNVIERKSTGSELAQLDASIKQASDAAQYFERVIEQATEANDGASIASGVKNMIAAQQKAQELANIKRAYQQQSNKAPALDPRLVSHANKFMSDNTWYNPKGTDVDSKLVLALDNEIASRGLNPSDENYWSELTKEVKKYLPHRMTDSKISKERSESRKSVVTGSGRESSASGSSKGTYTLSPERVQALKDAGMWEDQSARSKAIERYRAYDKANKR